MSKKKFEMLPCILDTVNKSLHLRTARIITRRMEGATLRDLSIEEGITRSEVRSAEKKGLERLFSNLGEVREDEYRYLYTEYNIDEDFYESLPNGTRILYYLKNRYECGLGSVEMALNDSNLSEKIIHELESYFTLKATDTDSDVFDTDINSLNNIDYDSSEDTGIFSESSDTYTSFTDSLEHKLYDLKSLPKYVINAIDDLWNALLACGITDEKDILEQVGILLFLKHLDDLEFKNLATGFENSYSVTPLFFDDSHQNCRWSYFHNMESLELFENMQNCILPYIKNDLQIDTDISYPKLISDVRFSINDATQLSRIISCIDAITVSANVSLCVVYDALIQKTSFDNNIMNLIYGLLDISLDDTICNMYPDIDFDLYKFASIIKKNCSEELSKVWNRMHFENDMFSVFGTDNAILNISALRLFLLDIASPKIKQLDVVNNNPGKKYNKIIAKISTTCSANPKYVRTSIKKHVPTNVPSLMYMYACYEALNDNGICIINVPHKYLSDSASAYAGFREFYIKECSVLGLIYIPALESDLIICQKTKPDFSYNVWFTSVDIGDEEDIQQVVEQYFSKTNYIDNSRSESSFFISTVELESNNYILAFDNYCNNMERSTDSYINPEPLKDILRRIMNTQTAIDRHLGKVKVLMEKLK